MPKVTVQKNSPMNSQEAFKKICEMLETDPGLRKLDPSLKCEFNNAALTGKAEGKMFKALMNVTAQGQGSEVVIEVDLPFHLALAKGIVKETLQKKLDKTLS